MSGYETKKIFAENLIRLLGEHNKTQLDLANQMNVAASTVSSWCTGDKMPRMDKVEWMAEYFGVPTSALIEPIQTTEAKRAETVKAAFWGGDKDLSQEEIELLWEDVRSYKEWKTAQMKQKKKE